jgi:hypothetical protein
MTDKTSEQRFSELEDQLSQLTETVNKLAEAIVVKLKALDVSVPPVIPDKAVVVPSAAAAEAAVVVPLGGGDDMLGHGGELMFEIPASAPIMPLVEEMKETKEPEPIRKVMPPVHLLPEQEMERKRKIDRIRAAVPLSVTSNPIAALTNFCRHHLKFDVVFEINEKQSGNPSEPDYHVVVVFPGNEVISEYTHSRKKYAKEQAAKLALKKINDDKELLERSINFSFLL